MMVTMSAVSFAAADTTKHTITIDNTDQHVAHSYEAYKVFEGNLDSQNKILSNVAWADGVNSTALLAALKATTDPNLVDAAGNNLFKDCTTATDVAKVISGFASTTGANQSAGAIDAVAAIIAANLGTKAADFTEGTGANAGKYTAEVTGDGYYFIKDATAAAALSNDDDKTSDTLSKYLLSVVKDTTIVAKDTGLTPDKKILGGQTKVADDSAAMGDVVEFEVTIPVPNTKKYVDHFIFNMNDKLPAGLTFFGLESIQIDGKNVPAANYALTAKTGDVAFTVPADADTAVKTTGGQSISIVFKNFKAYVEADQDTDTEGVQDLIGKDIVIKYKAVVNKDASFKPTGNENEVEFKYSTDPNHDYNGDEPNTNDPVGTTPKSKTRTYLTKLNVKKVDQDNKALAGATFELTGTALNYVLQTGEKYEAEGYTAKEGETIESGSYWKLKDGTYTTTDPATPDINQSKYETDTDGNFVKAVRVTYKKVLTEAAGNPLKLTATSDKDGNIVFEGLNAGTYKLKETVAPEGYNLDTTEYTLVIDWTDPTADGVDATVKANGGFSVGSASSKTSTGANMFTVEVKGGSATEAGDVTFETTIVNNAGAVLPGTGGIGTTIFYVLGSLLVVGCGIVLISRKRMENNK